MSSIPTRLRRRGMPHPKKVSTSIPAFHACPKGIAFGMLPHRAHGKSSDSIPSIPEHSMHEGWNAGRRPIGIAGINWYPIPNGTADTDTSRDTACGE